MTRKRKKQGFFRDWIKAILIALFLFWFTTLFIIQLYPVSESYMSSTLLPGDFVFVSKLSYGPRFPVTPLSIPFVGDNLPFSRKKSYLDWIKLPGFRLPGISSPKTNDLLFINYPGEDDKPIDRRTRYAKRCVGLPGDTILIQNKKIFINNNEFAVLPEMQFAYRVISKPRSINREVLNNLEITEGNLISEAGIYRLYMTNSQADSLGKMPFVVQVRMETQEPGFGEPLIFPQSPFFAWNQDYFGPIIIPSKNQSIQLDMKNLAIYRKVIELEKNKIDLEGNKILINGMEATEYQFKSNYFFVLDDNRDNSKDSRFWGFLPEDHIIGKVSRIAFSFNKRNEGLSVLRWKRIMKAVNKNDK
jgi:signal peptidase I